MTLRSSLITFCLALVLWSSLHSSSATAAPVVEYYRASSTQIERIQAVRLWWKVRDAARVDIYDSFRNVVIPDLQNENYIEVWPERTSTYTLLVYSSTGSLEQTVPITITVQLSPTPPPPPPATPALWVDYFTAENITQVPGQLVTLKWSVRNATRVEIVDQFGQLSIPNAPFSGTYNIYPTVTSTYTLRAYDAQGRTIERSFTATVQSTDPMILFFRGNTDFVLAGQPVTLEWRAERAVRASLIGPGIPYGQRDSLPAFSSLTIYPRQSGVYTLYAFAADGRYVQAQYTITVASP